MALNTVALTGVLPRAPMTRFEGEDKQLTTFTLRCDEVGRDGVLHALYVPVTCYGKTAEEAADLHAEALVGVEGKLMYRTTLVQGQKKSTLCVLARQITVLASVGSPQGATDCV